MTSRLILIRHLEKESPNPGAMYGSKTDMGITANATEMTSIHHGRSGGMIKGINAPETKNPSSMACPFLAAK